MPDREPPRGGRLPKICPLTRRGPVLVEGTLPPIGMERDVGNWSLQRKMVQARIPRTLGVMLIGGRVNGKPSEPTSHSTRIGWSLETLILTICLAVWGCQSPKLGWFPLNLRPSLVVNILWPAGATANWLFPATVPQRRLAFWGFRHLSHVLKTWLEGKG